MKNNIKLLDCTLRDGGYVNDWNFGHDNLISIFERLVDASVDIIEIGFLDERRPFDINKHNPKLVQQKIQWYCHHQIKQWCHILGNVQ